MFIFNKFLFYVLVYSLSPKLGDWTKVSLPVSHIPSPFLFLFLEKVLRGCPGRIWTWNPPIPASLHTGIIGVFYHVQLPIWLFHFFRDLKYTIYKFSFLPNLIKKPFLGTIFDYTDFLMVTGEIFCYIRQQLHLNIFWGVQNYLYLNR